MGILRWEAPRHWRWSILRPVYTHQDRLIDRPTLFVDPTVLPSPFYPSDSFFPPTHRWSVNLCIATYTHTFVVHTTGHRGMDDGGAATATDNGQRQPGNNTMQPTLGPIRSGSELLCRERPLGSTPFLHATSRPWCVHISATSPCSSTYVARCYY